MPNRVAIVGGGIIGVSTAVRLQEIRPELDITIIADKLGRDTTADGAAGIFRPTNELIPSVPIDLLRQWSQTSWNRFSAINKSSEAVEAGITPISGFQFFRKNVEPCPVLQDIVYHHRRVTKQEIDAFPDHGFVDGFFLTTLLIECRWYLPWLMRKYLKHGGKVEKRKVLSFREFVGRYDVVVNCTGYGSRELLEDNSVHAIRGQMLRVHAPWVKLFVYDETKTWIIPGRETVVLGGTRQMDNDNLEIVERDSEEIRDRTTKLLPSVKNAETQWVWVGLRPHREPVRLEKETMHFGDKKLKVVHNYGHGGNGVALSWGTAVHTASLVLEGLNLNSRL